jgi:hypothetical protein
VYHLARRFPIADANFLDGVNRRVALHVESKLALQESNLHLSG